MKTRLYNKKEVKCEMKVRVETLKAILALFVLAILAAIAIAAPYGPDAISRDNDSRRTDFDGGVKQVQAQAGSADRYPRRRQSCGA